MDGTIFDQDSFFDALDGDFASARSFVFLQSSFVSIPAVERILPSLSELIQRGVKVCVFIQQPKDWTSRSSLGQSERERLSAIEVAIQTLESVGVHVSLRPKIHEKLIVIDATILWDGSLNVLSVNPQMTSERMSRVSDVFKAMAAIARHRLDSCSICLSRSSDLSDINVVIEVPTLGPVVRARRKALGLTQDAIAEDTGLSRSFIHKVETSRIFSPRLESVVRLAKALDCKVGMLPSESVPFLEQYKKLSPSIESRKTLPPRFVGNRNETAKKT